MINVTEVIIHDNILLLFIVVIIGRMITISISNTKNRTAIKKNCDENGIRGDLLGSNPHSNGDIFSRSINVFFLIIEHNVIIMIDINITIIIEMTIFIITFS